MRLLEPRIAPANRDSWSEDQAAVLGPYERDNRLLNIFTTIGNNPKALKAFATWGGYVRRETALLEREKELLILRMGWLCKAGYEWTQHKRLALQAGLSPEEIESIKVGPKAAGWSEREATLLHVTDELRADYSVSDRTWKKLVLLFGEASSMDVVYIVGHYSQVCMILNAFGVQVENAADLDPDFLPGH